VNQILIPLLIVLLIYAKVLEIYIFHNHKKDCDSVFANHSERIDQLEGAVGALDRRLESIEGGLKEVTAKNNQPKKNGVGFHED